MRSRVTPKLDEIVKKLTEDFELKPLPRVRELSASRLVITLSNNEDVLCKVCDIRGNVWMQFIGYYEGKTIFMNKIHVRSYDKLAGKSYKETLKAVGYLKETFQP